MSYLWILVLVIEAAAATMGLLHLRKKGRTQKDVIIYAVLAGVLVAASGFIAGMIVEGTGEPVHASFMGIRGFENEDFIVASRIRITGFIVAAVPLVTVLAASRKGGVRDVLKKDIDGLAFRKLLLVALALGGAILGLISSQYFPAWGTIEKLGEPWSEARQSLIFGHVVAFAVLGAAIGVVSLWLKMQEAKKQ